MLLVIRYLVIERMDTDRGQIGDLIETGIVSLALMTIESQLCNILIGIGWSDETDITEPSRTMDIGIGHPAVSGLFLNHKKR